MMKVLLVNDSKFESIIMKDALNFIGYDVKLSDEYDAADLIKTYEPDFLIANYIMKEIKGDQLISMVKIQYPRIKCFLCSSNPSLADNIKNRRIDGFISTPVEKTVLEKTLSGGGAVTREIPVKKEHENSVKARTYCASCAKEVNGEGEKQFAFCPYCGHRL